MTYPAVFQTTLQKSEEWIKALVGKEGMPDERRAYAALRATLHQLRDRLPLSEATDLGAQLPMLIRGLYYEGYNPSKAPQKLDGEAFLAAVNEKLKDHPEIPGNIVVPRVFEVIADKVTPGEIDDVITSLPKDIQAMWPDHGRA